MPPNTNGLVDDLPEQPRTKALPIWVRAPTKGYEHYSQLSRGILVILAQQGVIRTVSLAAEGNKRGVRLYRLSDILEHLDSKAQRQHHDHGRWASDPAITSEPT